MPARHITDPQEAVDRMQRQRSKSRLASCEVMEPDSDQSMDLSQANEVMDHCDVVVEVQPSPTCKAATAPSPKDVETSVSAAGTSRDREPLKTTRREDADSAGSAEEWEAGSFRGSDESDGSFEGLDESVSNSIPSD
jgi:hypothetical protein